MVLTLFTVRSCFVQVRDRVLICYNINMMKTVLAGGAILDGLVIVANQYFGWSDELNYLFGALSFVWGFLILKSK